MEALFDRVSDAARKMPERLGTDSGLRHAVRVLSEYLDGGSWKQDYEMDETGMLPPDLKRGVLSQDGLYDLLCSLDSVQGETPAQG